MLIYLCTYLSPISPRTRQVQESTVASHSSLFTPPPQGLERGPARNTCPANICRVGGPASHTALPFCFLKPFYPFSTSVTTCLHLTAEWTPLGIWSTVALRVFHLPSSQASTLLLSQLPSRIQQGERCRKIHSDHRDTHVSDSAGALQAMYLSSLSQQLHRVDISPILQMRKRA